MADYAGQIDIRGINVDKLAKGFAEEASVMQDLVTVTPTSAREVRWFQKTAGFMDSTDTTAITASQIAGAAQGARPVVIRQTWTRNTSYVLKFFAESEWISEEDIKDSDPDVFGSSVRDIVRAVLNQSDIHIWNVMTENQSASNINSTTTTSVGGDQWDATSGLNPIKDIVDAMRQIRANSYDPLDGGVLFLSPKDHMSLMTYLYNQGAQAPGVSTSVLENGKVIDRLLGLRVVVGTFVSTDYAAVAIPKKAVTFKEFMPITTAILTEPGIGRKIRVWQEGIALLTDPKAVTLIVDTQT